MKKPNTHLSKKLPVAAEITVALTVIGLIVLFSYTALHKAFAFEVFREGLKNSPLIPAWGAGTIGVLVISLMLATSLLLVIGFWKPAFMKVGLLASTGLIALFTLYVTAIVTVAPFRPCVCIGLDERLGLGWDAHLLFNSVLLVVVWSATLLYYFTKSAGSDPKSQASKIFVATDGAAPAPKTGNFKKKGGIKK